MSVLQERSRVTKPPQVNLQPEVKSTARVESVLDRLTPLLVKRRQTVFFVIILLAILIELIEHTLIRKFGADTHIWFDLLFVVFVVPVGAFMALHLLDRTEKERERVVKDFNLRAEFGQRLEDACTWEELVSEIASYAWRVSPQANATLFVYNPHTLRMEPEAMCTREGILRIKPIVNISPDSLPLGSLPQLITQNGHGLPRSGKKTASSSDSLPPHRYDLPVTRNGQQIAVIKLEFPLGQTARPAEIQLLKSSIPVMALALEGAILQNVAAEQEAASETYRRQIAQNLHDTLAQNVGYLRLKLDQLTGENAIREIGVILQELENMRATADEAYQQVRNTLDELNPLPSEPLESLLMKQAEAISQRAGFTVRSCQIGTPHTLTPASNQQILYIVREALHNIEKHARASKVQLQFLWLESELIIKITDDGIGFDPRTIKADGHYGLWIMQHRAQELGGTLKVAPAEEGNGTEVTLWVPKSVYHSGIPANKIQ